MENPPKCLLLPIDGTDEALRPINFVSRLYPASRDVNLILCYIVPPLAPVYAGAVSESPDIARRRREILRSREQETRSIFERARKALVRAGFSEELIQEHVQQKEMAVAKHACLLADIRKADAILVQKRISSNLEGFLRGNSHSALLQHCLASPIWFVEGEAEPDRGAAICVFKENASLRLADHAGFMLSNTRTGVTLLHVARSITHPVVSGFAEVEDKLGAWFRTAAGLEMMPYLLKSAQLVRENGVEEERIRTVLVPQKTDTAHDLLTWCRENEMGIIGLGHSEPEGLWSFLKVSVTRKILSDFRNMAVWVTQ